MAQLGILTLHGMGVTRYDYADELLDDIRSKLGPDLANRIETRAVYYQDILQENQKRYFQKVKRRLRWDDLRQFMLYGFSDAASLEAHKDGENSPYFQAQKRVLDALRALYSQLEGSDRRVLIVAQSLGGQVISNYLWDATKEDNVRHGVWSVPPSFSSAQEEEFCRGRKTVRIFTTGCNIPIFVAGIEPDNITPIPLLHPNFEWHNYFDKDDVLGWPLRDLSESYSRRVTRDHAINAGLVTGFTPLSHQNYWRDRDFLNPLLRHIKRTL